MRTVSVGNDTVDYYFRRLTFEKINNISKESWIQGIIAKNNAGIVNAITVDSWDAKNNCEKREVDKGLTPIDRNNTHYWHSMTCAEK